MEKYPSPFLITNKMLNLVATILGKLNIKSKETVVTIDKKTSNW